jgi:hypothetical protein
MNTPGTKEDLILVGTFQNYMNEIVGEDTSLDKDLNALVRNFKPLLIIGGRALAIGVKRKSFVVLNNMVDTIKQGTRCWYHPSTRSILPTWKLTSDVHKFKRSFRKNISTTSNLKTLSKLIIQIQRC